MSEVNVTLEAEAPEAETPVTEPATNEHDVAVAEAEAAAEIAVAEIHAEAQEAAAETIADALESEAVQTVEEENQWLKERVAFLEGQQASQPPTMTTEANPSTLQPSPEAETETTDPMEVAEADPTISTTLSTPGETSETPTEVIEESEAPNPAAVPARKRRRILI